MWTFRNDGSDSWPLDTKFVFANGDKFGELEVDIGKEVKAGDFVDVVVHFDAPEKIGKFCSFYRFSYGKGNRFG